MSVVGKKRTGKSTLIDALRSLSAEDENSAKNISSTKYSFHRYTNKEKHLHLILHETDHTDNRAFLEHGFSVGTKKQDFTPDVCLILVSEDIDFEWIVEQYDGNSANTVIVRTKMQISVQNDAQEFPKRHNKHQFIESIRSEISKQLVKSDLYRCPLYLTDSFQPQDYDFRKLEEFLYGCSGKQNMVCEMIYHI